MLCHRGHHPQVASIALPEDPKVVVRIGLNRGAAFAHSPRTADPDFLRICQSPFSGS